LRVTPGIDTVTVPVLELVPVLALAVTLKEPLPVWLAGVMLPILSHEAGLDICHVLLEATLKVPALDAEVMLHELWDIVSTPGCGA